MEVTKWNMMITFPVLVRCLGKTSSNTKKNAYDTDSYVCAVLQFHHIWTKNRFSMTLSDMADARIDRQMKAGELIP